MAAKQNSIYDEFDIILDKFKKLIDSVSGISEMSKYLFLKLTRVEHMRSFKTYTIESQQTLLEKSPVVLQLFGLNKTATIGLEAFVPVMAPLKATDTWYVWKINEIPDNLLQNSFTVYTEHQISNLFRSSDLSFLDSFPPVRDSKEIKKIQSNGLNLDLCTKALALLKGRGSNSIVYLTESDKILRFTRPKANGIEMSVYLASMFYQCY